MPIRNSNLKQNPITSSTKTEAVDHYKSPQIQNSREKKGVTTKTKGIEVEENKNEKQKQNTTQQKTSKSYGSNPEASNRSGTRNAANEMESEDHKMLL